MIHPSIVGEGYCRGRRAPLPDTGGGQRVEGALQLLMSRYGSIRFAQVPERVLTKGFVILIMGNSKMNHLGAQGTFKTKRTAVAPFTATAAAGAPHTRTSSSRTSTRAARSLRTGSAPSALDNASGVCACSKEGKEKGSRHPLYYR